MTTSPGAGHDHPSVHDHHDHTGHGQQQYGLGPGDGNWDERYSASDQIWSGEPNGALVAGTAHLPAGRALDVGCGEGADAVWLARRGWQVTALDVSGVALARAASHGAAAGLDEAQVTWLHSGFVEAQLPAGSFDLVSAQYPVLRRTRDDEAERALMDAVAPGGTLLVVHHLVGDAEDAAARGFDPVDYVFPADVARLLDDGWVVEVDEVRPRQAPTGGGGAHHVDDVVLRARRRD